MKNEIMTVYFDRGKKYTKLLTVFLKSASHFMPDKKIKVLKIAKPRNIDHRRDTAFAFIAAAEYVLKSKKNIAICDCDLMFTNSIHDGFKLDYDIAVTVREYPKYNTGLWFFKPNERSKKFLKKWIYYTQFLMAHYKERRDLLYNQGGIDQASLYLTIQYYKKFNKKINILELPCQEWNACQSEWHNINEDTRIIHIKSKLRIACFGGKRGKHVLRKLDYLNPIVMEWQGYAN